MRILAPNQQCQSTEGISYYVTAKSGKFFLSVARAALDSVPARGLVLSWYTPRSGSRETGGQTQFSREAIAVLHSPSLSPTINTKKIYP